MTKEERQKLREAALHAQHGVADRSGAQPVGSSEAEKRSAWFQGWALQTSNSFRRIGMYGDGDVLCAVTQRSDGHPDLSAARGVLDYIVAAQPRAVLELLDMLDAADALCSNVSAMEQRLKDLEEKCHDAIKEAMAKLSRHLMSEVVQ